MEVHHHAHPEHGKKSWKSYFWEFLMLFLAVFCGFLAENRREHYIEHKRAHVYAASMVDDLVLDTVALGKVIQYWTYAAHNVDTLLQLLSTSGPDQIPSGKLYWYGLWGGASGIFVPNDATFQQMKSSGSLRYFTNKALSRKVAQYDQFIRKMQARDHYYDIISTEVRKLRSQIFAFQYNEVANQISRAKTIDQTKIDSFIKTNPPLLNKDPAVFNQYLEMVRSRRMADRLKDLKELQLLAIELLGELKKEYEL